MDWMRRQDVKEEPQEAPNALTPEDDDECYFEEDEGMVRETSRYSTCDRSMPKSVDVLILRQIIAQADTLYA